MRPWLGLALLLVACAREPARAPTPRAARTVSQLFLDEWFTLPAGRCRVRRADARLTESAELPFENARLKPDVRAVDVLLSCENELGRPARSRETLPGDMLVLLDSGGHHQRAPRPSADDEDNDRFVFELPSETPAPLPSVRRYDTDTGQRTVQREASVGTLILRGAASELQVALRPRFRDARFDAFVDRLAEALSEGRELTDLCAEPCEAEALRALTHIFGEVRERFRPARIELREAAMQEDGTLQLALGLSRPRRPAAQHEVARFELVLQQRGETYGIAAFSNREEARSTLHCGELREQLAADLQKRGATATKERCNVLGQLLPGACSDLDPALQARALNVGMECRGHAGLRKARTQVPGDFQLTMRRGRSGSGLDRSPRFVVVLFHDAHVVFHGRHWVSTQERSDGRTHPALLAALHAHVEQLDWFGRRGGQFDMERCVPSDDVGDVITVVSRDRQRMVLNREGCRGPFSEVELTDLRRHVEQVAGVDGWTEPQKESDDQGVQHWTLAE